MTYFLQKSPAKQDFTKPCSEILALDALQLHCTRGSHVSITVFPNVYNRVSLLSVMSWLGRNFKQVTHLFAVQCSQYFAKKLKQESQLFSLLFPCTLSFWSCVLVCFHLFLKKHCTQYNIRPVMVYICENMWLHSFSLSKQWAAE